MGDQLPPYLRPPGMNALAGAYPTDTLEQAIKTMKLTPQEEAMYRLHLSNLYGPGGVDNPDGSRSTLYQVGFTADDGRTYNVPSVYNGQILSPDNAIARAYSSGLGQFPSYSSPFEAENRYQRMHGYMERDTNAFLRNR